MTFAFTGSGDSFQGGTFGAWSVTRGDTFSSDALNRVKFKPNKAKLIDRSDILRDSQLIKGNLGLHVTGTPTAFTIGGKLRDRTNHSSASVPSTTSGKCS